LALQTYLPKTFAQIIAELTKWDVAFSSRRIRPGRERLTGNGCKECVCLICGRGVLDGLGGLACSGGKEADCDAFAQYGGDAAEHGTVIAHAEARRRKGQDI